MAHTQRLLVHGLCIASASSLACGGEPAPQTSVEAAASSSGREAPPPKDELAVTGLRGTLSQAEIQHALEPRMMKLSRCVERRASDVEWISGKVELTFHIALDGSVTHVFPSQSEMGDREAERCIVDVAKNTRFPAPHGGEADFAWSLEVPLDPEIRAPVEWDATQASEVLLQNAEPALTSCGGGSFSVTAYVDPEGRVVTAGAATRDEASRDKLDCVADAVRAWTFPSPGSYAAKISFGLR